MRVAFFSGSYDHIIDGVTLATHRQVRYLLARQVPVRVYAPSNDTPLLPSGDEFFRVPGLQVPNTPYCFAMGLCRKARDDLERFEPSLVHLATPDWLGLGALNWARKHDIPVIATFHTHFVNYLQHYRCGWLQGFGWRMLRHFYNRCDELLVSCDSIASELHDHGIRTRITLNPLGVDSRQFSPNLRSTEWRFQHGLRDDEVVVLFVGRIVWEKGLQTFANVVARLRQMFLPVRPVIVGQGPARNAFRSLMPNAIFTGRLGGVELATTFASSDLFLFPSTSETFGCVTVEALASGLPCVVADAPGSRDIVRNGLDGFCAGNEDQFVDWMAKLIRDVKLRRMIADSTPNRARQFKWASSLSLMYERFESQHPNVNVWLRSA